MECAARVTSGDACRRSLHERFLTMSLWRIGAFEQEKMGLETPLCGCISVGPRPGGDSRSRGGSSAVENMLYSPVNLGVADAG
jgi:hypothetical protein